MIDALREAFLDAFGRAPELAARAPGRVNLIGEHTDYNDGLVLPCAIDRDTVVLAARRGDGRFRVRAHDLAETASFDPPPRAATRAAAGAGWVSYLQGVVFALQEQGLPVAGLDAIVGSTVPRGSGLSSSAALEVAFVTALDAAGGLGLDPLARARIAHRAESGFVGVACGLMDQLASALGRPDTALRIDCRSLEVRAVPLPASLRLLIFDSGVRRALADGAYNRRRAECEAALAGAIRAGVAPPGARALRDLAPAQLDALRSALDPALFRRARHVVTENARVDAACDAFARGDLALAGEILRAGMESLRADFEVSRPELDALCELADATPGVFGSRLTGAGFGGCTIHLVAAGAIEVAADAVARKFAERFGRRPAAILAHAAEGAGPLAI